MRNVLGLITARGGSQSIPRKNIVPLAGRPLLAYTCEAALGSRLLTRVVLSTDDQEIAQLGGKYGVEVPFQRPLDLAQEDTPSLSVAQHALRWLKDHEGWETQVIVLLQPTSPLRQAYHIDEALERMKEAEANTVVSVVKVPHSFSPYSIMRLQDGWLHDFWEDPLPFDRFRRQNLPVLYARNGPAILASKVEGVLNFSSFYGRTILPYVMREEDSVDIDTTHDVRLAEWWLSQRQNID